MARGQRTASQSAYRGAPGRTQTSTIHVAVATGDLVSTPITTSIDAVANPELVEALFDDSLNLIGTPVVYHDPSAEVFALVLTDAQRHTEIDERIALLKALKADSAAIPAYAKNFDVVYGPAGLRDLLERRASGTLAAAEAERSRGEHEKRVRDLERRSGEIDRRANDVDRRTNDLDNQKAEVAAAKAELSHQKADLAGQVAQITRERAEVARERAELDRMRSEARSRAIAAVVESAAPPVGMRSSHESQTTMPIARGMLDSDTFDKVEPAMLLETEETHGRQGETEAPRARRETQDIPTGSEEALTGHPGLLDHLTPSEPESFEVDVETGITPGEILRGEATRITPQPGERGEPTRVAAPPAELLMPMAPDAAETVPGGPDVVPAKRAAEPASLSPWNEPEDETTGAAILPQGADPLTTDTADLPLDPNPDAWLDKVAAGSGSAFTVEAATVRLALHAGEELAKALEGLLDIRVLLHRKATYPIITVVIGSPLALRVPTVAHLAVLVLDIANDRDRAVLAALGRRFELVVDLLVEGRRARRVKLIAPLAENVGYILRAAEDHLRGVAAEGEPSMPRARDLVLAPGADLLGMENLEYAEFRDDKLAHLGSAQHARRAIAMARRFARPSREDYLVCTRGFPLPRWRELRRGVLETAVAWGLWMGPELAQVAVSEGLARSRRDLITRLDRGTETLRKHPSANDLDEGAVTDNATALAEEAKALGVELTKPITSKVNGALASENGNTVSGSIGQTPPKGMHRVPGSTKSTDELIALLDNREERVQAAIALCERGDPKAAGPVIATVSKLSRAEAVRVLGLSVKFGDAAKQPLMDGLKSSKAFLRHGCALALGLLRTEDGTQAVIDLLMTEPTEIWREVARAIGQVGPTALLSLASTYGRLGDKATQPLAERVAWAMAHVAVRGGKAAIETMAGGHSVVAPVAKQALELHASAANDQVRVRPGAEGSMPGRDVTVNRAFSRRFFEALEQGLPETGAAELEALDASSPMELLEDADLLEDDEEEIDEADLLT